MEIEFNELGFHVQKTSSMNSFSLNSEDGPSLNSEDNECLAASAEDGQRACCWVCLIR